MFLSCGRCRGPTYGRRSGPMHVHELHDLFFSSHHHVVEHVDDIVLVIDIVLGDLVDGDLELVVPDDIRDILVDIMRVLELLVAPGLLVVRNDDMSLTNMPLSSLINPLSYIIPLSSLSSPLSYLILSIIVPLSDVLSREGDDWCRGRTGRTNFFYGR